MKKTCNENVRRESETMPEGILNTIEEIHQAQQAMVDALVGHIPACIESLADYVGRHGLDGEAYFAMVKISKDFDYALEKIYSHRLTVLSRIKEGQSLEGKQHGE